MSTIAEFALIKNSKKDEKLEDGNLSGDIYMAILEYFDAVLDLEEKEVDAQGYEPVEEPVDIAVFDLELADEVLAFMRSEDFSMDGAADEIAEDWDLDKKDVKKGFKTLQKHLARVTAETPLLYEMF